MPGIQNSNSTLKWLGGVGSTDKGDRVSLNNVATALVELGEFLIVKAERNLDKKGNRATGKTASSMKLVNLQTNATKMSLDVEIISTYKFLNDGVKGVESGTGKYAFKSKYPNKKMAGEIKKWLRVRKIVSKYAPISKTESKNKKINKMVQSADGKLTGLSYAIATNIKKKGIKPTYFFSGKNYSAVEMTQKEQKKRFAKAFKLDIIENLKSN
jgi:hypothetical protein